VDLGNGWRLRAQVQDDGETAQQMARENADPYQAWFDFGKRHPHLNIRSRLPGERFHPLGMGGKSMKISDFMINQKIPQRARSVWPLICKGNEIVWVPGYQLAHTYRLMSDSKQVVKLSLIFLGKKA
jgi:tRNA(Ile)-lysidine synthase